MPATVVQESNARIEQTAAAAEREAAVAANKTGASS
jgi:hypothetical protein